MFYVHQIIKILSFFNLNCIKKYLFLKKSLLLNAILFTSEIYQNFVIYVKIYFKFLFTNLNFKNKFLISKNNKNFHFFNIY